MKQRILGTGVLAAGTVLSGIWLANARTYPAAPAVRSQSGQEGEGPGVPGVNAIPQARGKKTHAARPEFSTERISDDVAYAETVRRTAGMVYDDQAQQLVRRHGLNVLNLTWEDTGRYKNSSVGPNISDMTIQVARRDRSTEQLHVTCMPVIRYPNFSDRTCDLDPRDFTLLTGNQTGRPLKRVSLYDFLQNVTGYLSYPASWKSPGKSLLASRDQKVLVSAQACFLPVPKRGKAEFNPVLFNYQSHEKSPAVLTILATREGTSVTVIDNKRDAFRTGAVWGQRLFHNLHGERAVLTGERMSDFEEARRDTNESARPAKSRAGLNMVLLIQVPLKQKLVPRPVVMGFGGSGGGFGAAAPGAVMESMRSADRSDVENAVIGHGQVEGPFTEIDNLSIERDERFPVRVTVQFYKATSNGIVSELDVQTIKEQIDRVYAQSDEVGSLVTDGTTGRVTEYEGMKVQPAGWWQAFWWLHERNTGDSPEVAMAKLRKLLGSNYTQRPVCALYLHDLLRHSAHVRSRG